MRKLYVAALAWTGIDYSRICSITKERYWEKSPKLWLTIKKLVICF